MTSDSRRSLQPELIKRIGRLEVRARHIVEGFLSGMHRSPYFGQSIEFLQHRQYVSGDDLRHVDWKVWGKQDRLYVKQYEEDTNLRACLLVDLSASMSYGSGAMTKCDYACTAAAALAYLLLRQHDAVGCVAFDEKIRQTIPHRTTTSHLSTIVKAFERRRAPRQDEFLDACSMQVAENYPRRGMMVLFSDLLVDRGRLAPRAAAAAAARARRARCCTCSTTMSSISRLPGRRDSKGSKRSEQLKCNPRALRAGISRRAGRFSGKRSAAAVPGTASITRWCGPAIRSTRHSSHF